MSILRAIGLGRTPAAPAVRREPILSASGVAAPDPWLVDIASAGTRSRVAELPPVSPEIAQKHATVTACCSIIAGDLAKLPVSVFQVSADKTETRVNEHPANYLLNVESSPWVASIGMRFAVNYAFCLRGTAYAYAPRDAGGDLEMVEHIHQDLVSVRRNGRERFYDFEDGAEIRRRITSRTMAHMRYMSLDGWTGRSPLQVAAETIGIALAGQEAAGKAVSGSIIRAYAKMAGYYEDEESYQRNRERVRRAINEGTIPILGAEDEIKRLDLSAADQQLLESRKMDREQIAALYRMPPSKLQMLEHGVKANGEQQAIDYRSDCLTHWAGFIEAQLGLGIFSDDELRSGLVLRHDYEALMMATTSERFAALKTATGGPFMTPNEARERLNLKPKEGGDVLNPAANMTRQAEVTK